MPSTLAGALTQSGSIANWRASSQGLATTRQEVRLPSKTLRECGHPPSAGKCQNEKPPFLAYVSFDRVLTSRRMRLCRRGAQNRP